jgi:hypothetical protein
VDGVSYFSADYFESRDKFRQAVRGAGGRQEIHEHPSARGPLGETLTVDVAAFGRTYAPKVFFNINGIHGIEAYAGGAAQLQWIEDGALQTLPEDTSVVLVHDINPFGWAHETQRNEDLIDLNRNFINFDHVPATDVELHHALANAIAFRELSFSALVDAWRNVLDVARELGKTRFNAALMVGQYAVPQALKFGGDNPAWSNVLLRRLAEDHLAHAEKVAIIDWHTGLGQYGQPCPLHTWAEGSESWQRTARWWGEDAARIGAQGLTTGSAAEGDANTSSVYGSALQALFDTAPDATFAGGPIEFGTVPFEAIAQAAILDHWLMLYADSQEPSTAFWKAQMRTFFAPRERAWETSVLNHAKRFYEAMLAGLFEW